MTKIKVQVVTIEGNTGAGKTTFLQKFKESLSTPDKFKIRVEHEPTSKFQSFYGKKPINPPKHFYHNLVAIAFIFQNDVLGEYQRRLERSIEADHLCKVILTEGWTPATYLLLLTRR